MGLKKEDYLFEEGVVDLFYRPDFHRFHHPTGRDDDAAKSLRWGGHIAGCGKKFVFKFS